MKNLSNEVLERECNRALYLARRHASYGHYGMYKRYCAEAMEIRKELHSRSYKNF